MMINKQLIGVTGFLGKYWGQYTTLGGIEGNSSFP